MRKTLTFLTLGLLGAFAAPPANAYEVLQGPTELRFWDKEKAYNGYTLFSGAGQAYLIDMEGRVVHTWRIGNNPRLLDNGNLLDASKDDPSGFQGWEEVDWDGKVVWEYREKREGYAPHHDWVRIHNKALNASTTLYIANKTISNDEAIAAGCDPAKGPFDGAQMDTISEVDMKGNIVWEWRFFDHVVQDVAPDKPNYVGKGKTIADYPGKLNLNLPGRPLKRDWLHCNSLDYNPQSGHVVINSVQGELYVIDHDRTFVADDSQASIALAAGPTGDFLYRFGDPARYGQGDPPRIMEDWTAVTSGHKQIGGSHGACWIPAGLPGAGHILLFNNGQYLQERTNQSYAMEIDPYLDANGKDSDRYVSPPEAGYFTLKSNRDTHKPDKQVSKQIVWSFGAKSNQGFFSHIGGSVQRLPNGNTLICSDTEGHLFEVTAKGELAWEYINPATKELGTIKTMPDSLPMTNSVFSARRYGPDHPALKGRDLTPKGTITDAFARAPQPRREPRGSGGLWPGAGSGGEGKGRGKGGRDPGASDDRSKSNNDRDASQTDGSIAGN